LCAALKKGEEVASILVGAASQFVKQQRAFRLGNARTIVSFDEFARA
jgi:hypothetical protein